MSKLKVVGIKIKNLLGIEDLELHPDGNVIQVLGKNGSGKSSTLESIKAALGVSSYSNLVRNGAEQGEVVIDMQDMIINKKFKAGGSDTLTIKGKVVGTDVFSNISSPAKVLKNLISPNSVDPLSLLTAKPKDLLDAVLNAIPMKVDDVKFGEIVGDIRIDTNQHALITIAEAQKVITNERRDVNRDLKNATITMGQLQGTLPTELPDSSEVHNTIENNLSKIENLKSESRKAARSVRQEYSDAIELVDEVIEELEEKLSQAKSEKAVLLKEQEIKVEQASEDILNQGDELLEENMRLQEKLQSLAVYENTHKQINGWKSQARELQKVSDKMSRSLEGLQLYKEELCDNLPIEGLEIVDGMLSFNGVPFQTLNTAAKVKLVVKLAEMSAGELGIIVIDNSEHLDTEAYELFIKEANNSNLLFIVGRVSDTELTIK